MSLAVLPNLKDSPIMSVKIYSSPFFFSSSFFFFIMFFYFTTTNMFYCFCFLDFGDGDGDGSARQIGFEDGSECPQLCKLAYEYLKKSKECESTIYEYFADEPNVDELYVKLVEEFDRCILAYFAFHWSQASLMISQVLSIDSDKKKLKDLVLAATRKRRFERVSNDLKVTKVFSTLVAEMKAIGSIGSNGDSSKCTDVMVPVVHSKRSPVLLLMGGGMGAGKSTVLKDILKQSIWSEAAGNAVVVEADAFKETDVIYRALSSRGHHEDMLQTAELVHQSSTDAASSLLVTALNEGRDVIMDGTLSWEPFVEQTVAMARNVHKHRYRMGVGYKVAEDGSITENYWEMVGEEEEQEKQEEAERKPYRIELVGVVCDAYLAVVRGIRYVTRVKMTQTPCWFFILGLIAPMIIKICISLHFSSQFCQIWLSNYLKSFSVDDVQN
ncbi:hypothetical protein ACSBR2_031011 [Camellia fascicularis]